MQSKRLFYRPSSVQQRIHLFEIWQQTGNVQKACTESKVSRSTFYYWKKRFIVGGFEALKEERSHAPHNPRTIGQEIEEEVRALRKEHPDWGKARIAKVISTQQLEKTVSPNTVRRILIDANQWDR